MAIQYIGGASANGTSADYSIPLNSLTGGVGSSAQPGDLVLVVTGFSSTSDLNPGVTTAGYIELVDLFHNATRDSNLAVAYKRLTAAEASVTVTGSGAATQAAGAVVQVWRGVDGAAPIDGAVATASGGASRSINAPAVTPTKAGSVVVSGGIGTAGNPITGTPPAGWSNLVTTASDPGTAAFFGVHSQEWAGGAVDPGAWSLGAASGDSWIGFTLALAPAPEPPAALGGIPGLVWFTETPVQTTMSGAIIPAVPFSRAAGAPLHAVVSFNGPASEAPSGQTIFMLGVPTQNDATSPQFELFDSATPGRFIFTGNQPSAFTEVVVNDILASSVTRVWELRVDESGGRFRGTGGTPFDVTNAVMRPPTATTHLFLGYNPNNGTPSYRWEGTINRLAFFDQPLNSAQADAALAWAAGTVGGAVQVAMATTSELDAIASSASADVAVALAVASSEEEVDGNASTEVSAYAVTSSDADLLASAAAVDTTITASTASLDDILSAVAEVTWPATAASLVAQSNADVIAAAVSVDSTSQLSVANLEDVVHGTAGVSWPEVAAVLATTPQADEAQGVASVSFSATLATESTQDDFGGTASINWTGQTTTADLQSELDIVTASGAVSVTCSVATQSEQDTVAAVVDVTAAVSVLTASHADEMKFVAGVSVGVDLQTSDAGSLMLVTASVDNCVSMSTTSDVDELLASVSEWSASKRWAYPALRGDGVVVSGHRAGSVVTPSRTGSLVGAPR